MTDSVQEREQAQGLRQQLGEMVRPLLRELDTLLDKRLVATFFAALQALLVHRHSRCGLLLSELGGYILGPAQALAGTKRLSNLLRSRRWQAAVIERFLWQRAEQAVAALQQAGEKGLALWDESVLEKPENMARLFKVHPLQRASCISIPPKYLGNLRVVPADTRQVARASEKLRGLSRCRVSRLALSLLWLAYPDPIHLPLQQTPG